MGERYEFDKGVGFKDIKGEYVSHEEYIRNGEKVLRALVFKAIVTGPYNYGELLHENGLLGYIFKDEGCNFGRDPFEK